MKHLVSRLALLLPAVALVVGIAIPRRASAAAIDIESFHADISVQADGKVLVRERIEVDFDERRHGIFRFIPYEYVANDGSREYLTIDMRSISRNGKSEEYSTALAGSALQIKVGDARKEITGSHVYVLEYLVTGALKSYEQYDELYWNVTGSRWESPIVRSSATVTLPRAEPLLYACYVGLSGSKEKCSSERTIASGAEFIHSASLAAGSGLTVAVGYERGLVPILKGEAPTSVGTGFGPVIAIAKAAGITFALGLAALIFVALRIGRDEGDSVETVMAEYDPPGKLRPAELGFLMKERLLPIHISATIVDLASRGYLTITEEPKKGIFGKTDYLLARTLKQDGELLDFEKTILDTATPGKEPKLISKLKNTYYKNLPSIEKGLREEAVRKGLFAEDPHKVRNRFVIGGIALAVISGIGMALFGTIWGDAGVGVSIGLSAVGVLASIFAVFMPRRTAHGKQLLHATKGYKLFVSGTEKYRQPFFEGQNIFMEVLPYAILFGVTKKLAKALHDMGVVPTQPDWYVGHAAFNGAVFASGMDSFASAFAGSVASSPSSSGSGGGGFSGGGFGGGGGGSW